MSNIPNDLEFRQERAGWRESMALSMPRSETLAIQMRLDRFKFGYQFEWLGVPIIRFPDDIMVFQEIIHDLKPAAVIEVGVARGGGVVLAASLLAMYDSSARVLGIDIDIRPHCKDAIRSSGFGNAVELWEGDSSSIAAREVVEEFLRRQGADRPAVITLDSNHEHSHVLLELESFVPLLPIGSIVIVADSIIEECPAGHFANRPWGPGNSPMSALREFMSRTTYLEVDERWSRRGALTECRDSIVVVTGHGNSR